MHRKLASFTLLLALMGSGAAPAALAEASVPPEQHWNQAIAHEQQGRWKEAAHAFVRTAKAEQELATPRWEPYANIVARAAANYAQADDPEAAIRVLEQGAKRLKQANQPTLALLLLNQLGKQLRGVGRLDDAIAAHREAVSLAQAAGHEQYLIVSLSRVAMALSVAGRYEAAIDHFEQALGPARRLGKEDMVSDLLSNAGQTYANWGRHEKALELQLEALGISRKRGDAFEVAYLLSDLAGTYKDLGRYAEARAHAEEAVAGFRKLNDRGALAMALNTLSTVREVRGEYPEALAGYEEALGIQKAEGLRRAAATTLNNIAGVHLSTGRYEEALRVYTQALAETRALGLEPDTAITLNNMGSTFMYLARYDEALRHIEEALAIHRKLGRDHSVANCLGNLGQLYGKWGRHDKALPLYEEALAIERKANRPIQIAHHLSNMADIHLNQGRAQEALACEEQALAIYRQQGASGEIAVSLVGVGAIHQVMGHPDRALPLYQEGLALGRKLGQTSLVVEALRQLGSLHSDRAAYAEARPLFVEALGLARRLGERDEVATLLSHVAIAESRLGNRPAAIAAVEEAVSLLDQLRQTARGELRRDYLALSLNTYQHLVDLHARTGHGAAALEASERSRAKVLAEMLTGRDEAAVPNIDQVRAGLGAQSAALVFACTAKPDMVQVALTRDAVTAKVTRFQMPAAAPAAAPAKPAKPGDVRGVAAIDEPEPPDTLAALVQQYRQALLNRDAGRTRALGRALYDVLVKPLEPQLAGKTQLVVVPDAAVGYVPFEALVDAQGRYLGERFAVTYAHSLAVRQLLAARQHPEGRQPLLAFGGATYQAAVSPGTRGPERQVAKAAAYQALSRGGAMLDAYQQLGHAQWADLPGTKREVEAIAKLQPGARVITGQAVTESQLKVMAASGELGKYRVLHFATHGLTVPEVPELSALVLSQLPAQPGGEHEVSTAQAEDGYLRTPEVAALKLQADFVNLSACETGLGKLYGGEGVVGLAQAFLLAGANGLSMSLWSVADDSTATFMTELYKTVAKDKVSHAEAASRVKRRFIKGEFGEAYKQPFYWAPFVHYGI